MKEKKMYLNQYELPALNFYESSKDIRFMLRPEHRHMVLTPKDENLLQNIKAEIAEWGSKEVDLAAFESFYFKITQQAQILVTAEAYLAQTFQILS